MGRDGQRCGGGGEAGDSREEKSYEEDAKHIHMRGFFAEMSSC